MASERPDEDHEETCRRSWSDQLMVSVRQARCSSQVALRPTEGPSRRGNSQLVRQLQSCAETLLPRTLSHCDSSFFAPGIVALQQWRIAAVRC